MAPNTIILPPRDTHFYLSAPPSVHHTLFTCCQTVQTWTHQSSTRYANLPWSISCVLSQISGISLYFSFSVMVSLLLFCPQVLLLPVSDAEDAVAPLVIVALISSRSTREVFLRSFRLRILRCFTCLSESLFFSTSPLSLLV